MAVTYDSCGALHPLASGESPAGGARAFSTVRDWWFWQYEAMAEITAAALGPVCSDEGESVFEVAIGSGTRLLERGRLSLGWEGLSCGKIHFPLADILDLAITGQRTLALSAGGRRYEFKNERPRSAAKYQRVFELLRQEELSNGFFRR
jgi:hypothetical protein